MAAIKTMITQCTDQECQYIMQELLPLDAKIRSKVKYVQANYGLNLKDSLEYVATNNPVLWAKCYIGWTARDYQIPILTECKKSKKLVLRLGRRLGKSDSLCIAILWYAYTQYNRGENNQYDIVIATPYETQIDLIFKRLKQLLAMSPVLTDLIIKDVQHKLALDINGIESNIIGFTAGANNSSGGANSTRGQRADVLILDEADKLKNKAFRIDFNVDLINKNIMSYTDFLQILSAKNPVKQGKLSDMYDFVSDLSCVK